METKTMAVGFAGNVLKENAGKDSAREICGGCGTEGREEQEFYFVSRKEEAGAGKDGAEACQDGEKARLELLCAGCAMEHVMERVPTHQLDAFINRMKAEKTRREQKINSSYPGRT